MAVLPASVVKTRVRCRKVRVRRRANKHPPERRSSTGMSQNTLNTVPFARRVLGGAGRGVGRAPRNRVAPDGRAPRERRENASAVPESSCAEMRQQTSSRAPLELWNVSKHPQYGPVCAARARGGGSRRGVRLRCGEVVVQLHRSCETHRIFAAMPCRGRATMPTPTLPRCFRVENCTATSMRNS